MNLYLVASYLKGSEKIGGGWEDLSKVNIHLCTGFPERNTEYDKMKPMRLKILLSYWYYKNANLDELFKKYFKEPYPQVFADSGAYSAMTQGVDITVKEYVDWVKKWQHLFDAYSVLDVIKDAKETWKNQMIMEEMGLQPIPAFHVQEDWKWLEKYVDKYPYIALGVAGMQSKKRAIMAWLVKCFQIAGNQAVFHGFALTSWKVMSSFPWYSVDSSSWGSGFRYGRVPIFDYRNGKFYIIRLGTKDAILYRNLLDYYGFNPLDFVDRLRNDRVKICTLSALSYLEAEKYLNNKFYSVSKIYLADANPNRLKEANKGMSIYLADTGGIRENYKKANDGVKIYLADTTSPARMDLVSVKKELDAKGL